MSWARSKRPRKLALWWDGDPDSSRSLQKQRQDRNGQLFDWVVVFLLCLYTLVGYIAIAGVKADSAAVKAEVRNRSVQRTDDLRAQCRRDSRQDAADVNLNWVYYQSEELLAGEGEGGSQTVKVILARASADYQAAYAKAKNVDTRDLAVVKLSTPLGSEAMPRAWVVKAHFSCIRAFKATTG